MEEENVPITWDDIKNLAAGRINLFLYDNLKGKTLADLHKGTPCAIILLQIHNGRDVAPVGHWIAVIDTGSGIEHFDPYGLTIDQELSYTHEEHYLSQILEGHHPFNSPYKFQKHREDVQTCGRWCVVRCNEFLINKMSIREFDRFIGDLGIDGDLAVTLMTRYPV